MQCFKHRTRTELLRFPFLFDRSLAGARYFLLSIMSILALRAHSPSYSVGGVLAEGKAPLPI
jgi:hypothetical protein